MTEKQEKEYQEFKEYMLKKLDEEYGEYVPIPGRLDAGKTRFQPWIEEWQEGVKRIMNMK